MGCIGEFTTNISLLGGLDPQIANFFQLHAYFTLEELRLLAHKIERKQKFKGKDK